MVINDDGFKLHLKQANMFDLNPVLMSRFNPIFNASNDGNPLVVGVN